MGKVTSNLYDIYITEVTNCAETMFRAGVESRRGESPACGRLMMSGFSGGCSCEDLCGAIAGGIAAISHMMNKGDEDSFEASKDATKEFVELCREDLGTTNCHEIKTVWRKEEIRCYQAVEKIAKHLETVLAKYNVK